MNDNSEQIALEIDETPALQSINRANVALEGYEKRAVLSNQRASQSFEQAAGLIVRTSDRSRTSVERLVASAEKLAQTYGKSGVERLVAQRDQLIQRLGQESAAVDRVRAAYDKMIAAERGGSSGNSRNFFQSIGAGAQSLAEGPLAAVRAGLEAIGSIAGPVGKSITGAVAAIGSLAVIGFEAAKSLAVYGQQFENVGLRTGLSTREIAQFGFAAKLVDQDISIFERTMKGLTAAVLDNSEEGAKARKTLDELGVRYRALNGDLAPTGEILLQISRGLNNLPEGFERTKVAMDLFKKTGIEALPAIMKLAEGVKLANEQGLFGPSVTELQKWDDYDRRVTVAEAKWDRFVRKAKGWAAENLLPEEGYYERLAKLGGDPRPNAPSAPSSGVAAVLMAGDSVRVGADVTRGNAILRAGLSGPEALSSRVAKVKQEYEEAYRGLTTMSNVSSDAATQAVQKVAALRSQYEALNQQLERRNQLEGTVKDFAKQTASVPMQMGNRIVWTTPFEQQLRTEDTKRMNAVAAQAKINSPDFEWGEFQQRNLSAQMFGITLRLNGRTVNRDGGGLGFTDQGRDNMASGVLSGFAQLQEQQRGDADRRVQSLDRAMRLQEQLVKLQTGPGGEKAAIEETFRLRLSYAQQVYDIERRIIGDTLAGYKLEADQEEARIERVREVAELRHKQFDDTKQSISGLIDATLAGGKGIGAAMGNMFKSLLLTPVKEAAASAGSRMLTPLLYGQDGGGGIVGRITGLFGGGARGLEDVKLVNGAVPVMIVGGSSSLPSDILGGAGDYFGIGAGNGFGVPGFGRAGAPGGTSGFAGPVSLSGGGGGGGGLWDQITGVMGHGGLSKTMSGMLRHDALAGAARSLAGLAGFPLALNGIRRGGGAGIAESAAGGAMLGYSMGGAGGIGEGLGIGLGAGLVGAGLRRGGVSGLAMDTAGGALIGGNIGGPLGAAIGAGAGFLGGVIRLFVHGKQEKIRDLIQQLYGVRIESKGVVKQIADMADQGFGGDIQVAVRSASVRELVRLYAETTGQNTSLTASMVHAASLTETGGRLYQGATYANGLPYVYASGLPSLAPRGAMGLSVNGPNSGVTVQLDAQQTVDLWRTGTTQAIQGNSRGVAESAVRGSQSSASRLGLRQVMAPGYIAG